MMNSWRSLPRRMEQFIYCDFCKGLRKSVEELSELRRYIDQQKKIILYYEEAVKPSEEKTDGADD